MKYRVYVYSKNGKSSYSTHKTLSDAKKKRESHKRFFAQLYGDYIKVQIKKVRG